LTILPMRRKVEPEPVNKRDEKAMSESPETRTNLPSRRFLSEPSGMTEPRPSGRKMARLVRKKWFWAVVAIPLSIAGVLGWLTEPLETPNATPRGAGKIKTGLSPVPVKLDVWPTTPMNGRPAMILLLNSLRDAKGRLQAAGGYTAILHKTERLKGKLGDEQLLEMKCRNDPFSVYFKYIKPEAGKEVLYAVGHYDNNVIAHGAGFSRALIPRLKVPPTSAIAMSGNRHPITEAGLLSLTNRLLGFREMDLKDREAETMLDRVKDKDGREWFRSLHTHTHYQSDRPFMIVEVLYDPVTRIPVEIKNYDWTTAGEKGTPKLAETYRYENLKLGVEFSDVDFDPANPAYAFSRF
jgi:hypothetical protein